MSGGRSESPGKEASAAAKSVIWPRRPERSQGAATGRLSRDSLSPTVMSSNPARPSAAGRAAGASRWRGKESEKGLKEAESAFS